MSSIEQAIGNRAIAQPDSNTRKPVRGTWIARYRTEDGGQQYESLGALQDYPVSVQFEVVCTTVREWFAKCRDGMSDVVTDTMARDEYRHLWQKAAQHL
jgi:hypothetical protein